MKARARKKVISSYQNTCIVCKARFKSQWASELCEGCSERNKKSKLRELNERNKATAAARREAATPTSPALSYTFQLFRLSSETLRDFVFLDNRRKIGASNLQGIYRALTSGKHFDSPIVVSKSDGLFYVIDGNHRIEAFKKVVSKYPKFSLDVLLIVYDNLEDDERIEVFRRWNVGRPQTTDDFIQSVAHKIPFIRWLKDEFPIKVTTYKQPDSVHVRPLCNGYMAAKRLDDTARGFNKHNFVDALQKLDEKDFTFLTAFAKQFKATFGEPSRTNKYYRTTFLQPCLYLAWEFDNGDHLWSALSEKINGNEEVLRHTKMGGREANRQGIQLMKDKLKLKPVLKVA